MSSLSIVSKDGSRGGSLVIDPGLDSGRVGLQRAHHGHEEPAEEAPGALADAEEERAHEPHDAGDRVGRRDLGDVGHG